MSNIKEETNENPETLMNSKEDEDSMHISEYQKSGTMIPEIMNSYLNYSMSVIISRAIPSVEDGLKPVHRRILYGMLDLGATHKGGFRKSSRAVGTILGKYHPHGESSVYNALVKLAQPFSIRYPLVTGHGNFGSEDGDPPAAQRYTNCKLSRLSEYLLREVNNISAMVPNFDGTEKEPRYLPAMFPNILVNGTHGIAVGFATSMPPHNLREVADVTCHRIDNPNSSMQDLMQFLRGPDFPTGGIIINPKEIEKIYQEGRGSLKIMAKCRVIDQKTKELIFYDMPPRVQKPNVIQEILKGASEGKIQDLIDISDESSRGEQRLRCIFGNNADLEVARNQIYYHTSLETHFAVTNNVLINNKPVLSSLSLILDEFIKFRLKMIRRELRYHITKLRNELFILQGMVIALQNIDSIIEIIKQNPSSKCHEIFKKRYDLDRKQTSAILAMRLSKLSKTESQEILKQNELVSQKLASNKEILESRDKQKDLMKSQLQMIGSQEGDERRTDIKYRQNIHPRDLIKNENEILIITENTISKHPLSTYRLQKRSGKGTSLSGKDFEMGRTIQSIQTLSTVFLFSQLGKVFNLRSYDIPPVKTKYSKPHSISSIINISPEDTIVSSLVVDDIIESDENDVVICTRNGYIKRISCTALITRMSSGKIAIGVGEKDALLDAKILGRDGQICIFTNHGRVAIYPMNAVRLMKGTSASGVRAIKLVKEDKISGFFCKRFDEEDRSFLLSISENGYGKLTKLETFPIRNNRPATGVYAMKIDKGSGRLVSVLSVKRNEEIMLITQKGQSIRFNTKTVRIISRVTKGVKLISLDSGDKIIRAEIINPITTEEEKTK